MSKPKQKPTLPLRCRKCGSRRVRVSRTQNQLSRQFRRDDRPHKYLHAACHCPNPKCRHEWWSAHEDAVRVSKELDAKGQESRIVDSYPARKASEQTEQSEAVA